MSQAQAAQAIDVSQATYSRIEDGSGRALRGDELVMLADELGVRVAAIADVPPIAERVLTAARTDGTSASMSQMRDRLCSYLELDSYLSGKGL